MASRDISFLPEEMLLKIFHYLRMPDIVKMTLVCKKWNRLISNSSKLMSKMKIFFFIGDSSDYFVQEKIKISRKYSTIRIIKTKETIIQKHPIPINFGISWKEYWKHFINSDAFKDVDRLEIDGHHFTEDDYNDIFQLIPASVKQIYAEKIYSIKKLFKANNIKSFTDTVVDLDISKDFHGAMFINDYKGTFPKLKSLSVEMAYSRHFSGRQHYYNQWLKMFLQRNPSVKHLTLVITLSMMFSYREWSDDDMRKMFVHVPGLNLLQFFADSHEHNVETCRIIFYKGRAASKPFPLEATQNEREILIFSRVLTEPERSFFIEY